MKRGGLDFEIVCAKLQEHERIGRYFGTDEDCTICDACRVPFEDNDKLEKTIKCQEIHAGKPCDNIISCGQPWCLEKDIPECASCKRKVCTKRCDTCDAFQCPDCIIECFDCDNVSCKEHIVDRRCVACVARRLHDAKKIVTHHEQNHPNVFPCDQCKELQVDGLKEQEFVACAVERELKRLKQ